MSGEGSSASEGPADLLRADLARHERIRPLPGRPPALPPRYEILELAGYGATSVVYRAHDRELRRDVAVKALKEILLGSAEARERFVREAQALARMDHPNVVRVFDAGGGDEGAWLILELVEGESLAAVLEREPPGSRRSLELLEKAARGVRHVHERGIVHRDLKPQNILVTPAGEPKVGDFGLAHLSEGAGALTRTGTAVGTPLYMAPEQVEGRTEAISPRTDVYALGAILYQILTGRLPHEGRTPAEVYARILGEHVAPPRLLRRGISPELDAVAQKALERDPHRRYADAGEFADDLRRALDGGPVTARPASPLARLGRRLRRRRRALVLGAVAAAAAAAFGVWAGRERREALRVREERDRLALLADPRPWKPVFDGTSTACFMGMNPAHWRLENGVLRSVGELPGSVQTVREFDDGDVRVRFSVEGPMTYLAFHIRLGREPGYEVWWHRGMLEGMAGAERELVFRCRGESVRAYLDGAPVPVEVRHPARRGTLHFGGVGGTLRIHAIDWREPE